MTRLKSAIHIALLTVFGLSLATHLSAQCENWINSPQKEAAEEAHVLYRQFFKQENYAEAFPYWQKAYEMAPAADGQRPFHYMDGRTMYMEMFKNETDDAKKKEYAETILRLYDEEMQCYKDSANLLGLKVYDMFYYLRTPYAVLLETLEQAVSVGGQNTSYVVLEPYASVVVYEYEKERFSAEDARDVYIKLNEVAEYNVANNAEYGEYYGQARDRMNNVFSKIEYDIFDCDFYKDKFAPEFAENKKDKEVLKRMYNRLIAQGCAEDDPFVQEINAAYEAVIEEQREEFYKENPGVHAKDLFDEGQYAEAIEKYKEAIEKEKDNPEGTDDEKLSQYNFAIASILFRQMKSYSSARDYARKAAKLDEDWGRPYMLIGDMYAATSSSCGKEAWDQQIAILAAIDKYSYARSIDESVREEANQKIARYSEFRPDSGEGHMRGVSEGSKVKVKCWIGETVQVRFN
jgi:tetratricopeptide (TPR) repeat protein